MESKLLVPNTCTLSTFLVHKSLNSYPNPLVAQLRRSFFAARPSQISSLQLRISGELRRFGSASLLKCLGSFELCGSRPQFAASYSSAFAPAGGGFDGVNGNSGGDGGGGKGDGAAGGGDSKPTAAVQAGDGDASALSSDVIILDVRGMTCGGCAASVKRILESQAQVSSASVNLTTETAIVWPVPDVKIATNWRKDLGEALANHLTNCGFKSNLRDLTKVNFFETFEKKINEKHHQLKKSGRGLVVSWALCAVCIIGHLSHFFGAKAAWIHALHSTGFHVSLSLFTLLGPGRQLIMDGLKSLLRGAPNMNTLVGIGALSSFAVSSLAALMPKMGWKTFFEEPVMLIAFVLLGRNLEQRAKIKATSDMTGLLTILPSKARLLINGNAEELGSTVEVHISDLSVGDQIVVLPGDRIPADGVVRSGRSSVDESSFTGEPLPVTKLPGAEVAAGSINLNGKLTVEVQRPGGETAIGDIVRLVEEAQTREAPVQRLADKVAGHFTYGVMALSAATFMFWNHFGSQILPAALHQGSPISLALQLSCSVLVVACPCALGLATPTAVLVGTSLGATRGLLLRGGSILEKFSTVNTIVFDKTGTLTIGKPSVTKVVSPGHLGATYKWSEADILKLAAGVESNTLHPIGKAIVEAAKALNCPIMKVVEGTFNEEPGSGAVAIVDGKNVAVGTLEWVKRHGIGDSPFEEAEEFKNQSIVYVGVDSVLAGIVYVEDQIREDARHVIESLTHQGINTYLLSGDKKGAAEYVASIVGIPKERVLHGVKPDEKKKFIGVAIGGGVGAASEVSSIVLMQNRLSQLLDALELSRLTMRTVKQNLWWAFAYNIIGIPVAAGILLPVTGTILSPSIAGALMGFSSIGVMTNSLLLRLRFASKEAQLSKTVSHIKAPSDTDNNTKDENDGLRNPLAATR
ncbi:hypothetical protein F511_14892 [Dorcoceras hygrometricum]|uniref:HMA domain-containing protein n=1 Tax=Dorcoceras hygrometricum TaxID=472368 RepID=A0A2Z7BRA6_9LAMI|nr:hypothetical protein F511_14892 [Dorcoceras hygrometricum]